MAQAKRLTGGPALAYLGVEAAAPPDLIINDRQPNANDSKNFNLGHLWLIPGESDPEIWMLVALIGNSATWVQIYPHSAGGTSIFQTDAGTANAAGATIQVLGGLNINTTGSSNIVTVNLDTSIFQPDTNASASEGMYSLGGNDFMHNYGTSNTWLGTQTGNRSGIVIANATNNTGIGARSLFAVTSGDLNTAVGSDAMFSQDTGSESVSIGASSLFLNTDGDRNTAVGYASLQQLNGGDDNIALGHNAAQSYTGTESDNIIIGNTGTVGDGNTIRIGTDGSGTGQQDACHVAGIYNRSVGATNAHVFIDNTGKLGTVGGSGGASGTKETIFTTSGTWTKDPNAKLVTVIIFNGGAGGGSGQRGTSNLGGGVCGYAGGGGGGASGGIFYSFPASIADATESVIVGAGASGGAAITVDNTNGNNGGNATISKFGNIFTPDGPLAGGIARTGGTGGTNGAGGSGGSSNASVSQNFFNPNPINSNVLYLTPVFSLGGGNGIPSTGILHNPHATTSLGLVPVLNLGTSDPRWGFNFHTGAPAGGGGGHTFTCAGGPSPQQAGTGAGFALSDDTVIVAGGSGGIESGTIDGANGADRITVGGIFTGGAGGGGGGNQVGGPAGGNGGDGGFPGGAGGGGGASLNGNNSGAGGDGGDGLVIVYEFLG